MTEQVDVFLEKVRNTGFKIYKEKNPLVGESYTVMHIESVIDIMDLICEWSAIRSDHQTFAFVNLLKDDILKSIGREGENNAS